MQLKHKPLTPAILTVLVALTPLQAYAAETNPAREATLGEIEVKSVNESTPAYNPPTATSATKSDAPLRDVPQTIQTALRRNAMSTPSRPPNFDYL